MYLLRNFDSRIAQLKRTETALARSEDSRRSFEEKFERVLSRALFLFHHDLQEGAP